MAVRRLVKKGDMVEIHEGRGSRVVTATNDAENVQVSPPNGIPGWGQVHGFTARVDDTDPSGDGTKLVFVPSEKVIRCWREKPEDSASWHEYIGVMCGGGQHL